MTKIIAWLDEYLPLWRGMIGIRLNEPNRQIESIGIDWNIFEDEK